MAGTRALAYIDESGQRSVSATSSDHFVMSAVCVTEQASPRIADLLCSLRKDLGRHPHHHLSWKNLKSHSHRLHAAQEIGRQPWLTVSSVVVCKRHLTVTLPSEDHAYLFTLRFLLERLSWLARDSGCVLTYTLAHVIRFQLSQLRKYETILKREWSCTVEWSAVDPRGGRLDQPQRVEQLQLADLVASATASAFEPDRFGNAEPRYLEALAPRLYRRRGGALTSYGLKMHPWCPTTKAAYPWVAAL